MKIRKKDYIITYIVLFIYYSVWIMDGTFRIYLGLAFAVLLPTLFIGSISNLIRLIIYKRG